MYNGSCIGDARFYARNCNTRNCCRCRCARCCAQAVHTQVEKAAPQGGADSPRPETGSAVPPCGLLRYRQWWERVEVDLAVMGERITGVPIFLEEDTLRVINRDHSYFIPLGKIDYIRTTDGLRTPAPAPRRKKTKRKRVNLKPIP